MKSALFICVTLVSIITYTLSIAETIFDDRTKSSTWADVTIVVLAVGFFRIGFKSRSERIQILVG